MAHHRFFSNHSLYEHLKQEDQLARSAIDFLKAQQIPHLSRITTPPAQSLGKHILIEFSMDNSAFKKKLQTVAQPEKILQAILLQAAKIAGATILKDAAFSKIDNHMLIYGIVVISESHLHMRYMSQYDYVALDVFTCGDIKLAKAVKYIAKAIKAKPHDSIKFERGIYQGDFLQPSFVAGIAKKSKKKIDMDQKKSKALHFFNSPSNALNGVALGQHYIVEFYQCNARKINNAEFVLDTFYEAIGKKDISFAYVHPFIPQGISAVVMGDHYLLTIHDWPENGYGAFDLCVFNQALNPQRVLRYLEQEFQAQKTSISVFPRGYQDQTTHTLTPIFSSFVPKMLP